MRYEQPSISALDSAQHLVQGNAKSSTTCIDHDNNLKQSSTGAYELDE
jgi:hypothetical protein